MKYIFENVPLPQRLSFNLSDHLTSFDCLKIFAIQPASPAMKASCSVNHHCVLLVTLGRMYPVLICVFPYNLIWSCPFWSSTSARFSSNLLNIAIVGLATCPALRTVSPTLRNPFLIQKLFVSRGWMTSCGYSMR